MFAYLDPAIMKQTSMDYSKIMKSIKALDNYVSIRDIIAHAKEQNYPGDKCLYTLTNAPTFSESLFQTKSGIPHT